MYLSKTLGGSSSELEMAERPAVVANTERRLGRVVSLERGSIIVGAVAPPGGEPAHEGRVVLPRALSGKRRRRRRRRRRMSEKKYSWLKITSSQASVYFVIQVTAY